jgi:hypothetical protein
MHTNHQPHEKAVLLLVCLENNPSRSLRELIPAFEKKGKIGTPEGRDDVLWLSDNAILFDNTTALDIYGQLCLNLDQTKVPYMTVHTESTYVKVLGKFSTKVQATLKTYEIPLVTS